MRDGAVVARRAHNPKVVSSSLAPATKIKALHFGVRLFFVPNFYISHATISFETNCIFLIMIDIFKIDINYC